ncbi:16982_t:CDS:1, partial [Racocetra persica]
SKSKKLYYCTMLKSKKLVSTTNAKCNVEPMSNMKVNVECESQFQMRKPMSNAKANVECKSQCRMRKPMSNAKANVE